MTKEEFKKDIKRSSEILVYAAKTSSYFKITKREAVQAAKDGNIQYYLTDKIFVVKRVSMVII